jgi:CNT family concentrative nucleoside transporter
VAVGELLGIRMVANEFIAYEKLADWIKHPRAGTELTERSRVLLTYALCGFANFGSIGIQIGGIGALAPERRSDLARLGLRAMLGGTLACFMTACVAGILL